MSAIARMPDGQAPVFPAEDTGSTTVVSAGGVETGTQVCKVQCKNALQPWLIFIGNALDAGLIGNILFFVVVDGATLYPYTPTKGQWAAPENPDKEIPPLRLPQNALVEIRYNALAGAAGALNVTARLRVVYTPIQTPFGGA
jgi:hypothetical protein